MSKAKRTISSSVILVLSIILVISSNVVTVNASEKSVDFQSESISADSEKVDSLDLMIASYYFLASEAEDQNYWTQNNSIEKIVPLYDLNDNNVAFYVRFTNGNYTIVNNDKDNLSVIEYGEGGNELIEEIISKGEDYYIIFNNSFDLYNLLDNQNRTSRMSTSYLSKRDSEDYYESYPDLVYPNSILTSEISSIKSIILSKNIESYSEDNNIRLMGDGDYGFIDLSNMPSGSYSSDNVIYLSGINWATTGQFTDIASDHCGAVFVTNLALYYANRGYSSLKISNTRNTFVAVHKIVGNGPKITVAGNAKTYFSNRGYTLNYSSVGSFDGIKNSILNNRPLGILLADGIFNWHWVMAVGWRQYSSNNNYMRIVNGWNASTNKYYKVNSGSAWWSATSYWVG